jgi:putative ferrous iron transport protein C
MSISLVDIKQHMMQVRMATLSSLCQLFNADPDVLRCMLRHWVGKGKIRQCIRKPACGSQCFRCPAWATEVYEWVEVN